MDLFDIAAKITLDTSDYEKNLSGAEKSGSGFAEKLKKGLGTAAKVGGAAIGAIGTAAVALGKIFVDGINDVAAYGDEVDKMSQKLGLSKTAYQEWDYVLGQAGVEINNMSTGLKTLTNKLDEAKNGSEDAQKMFASLGLSMEELSTMSREDVFASVVTGFQGMADSTERAALANDLFGKSGQELTPLFNSSIEETNELRQAAHDLGFVLSDEAVSAAADFNDSVDTLQRTVGGLKNQFLQNFLPAATSVSDGLTKIFSGDTTNGLKDIKKGVSELVNTLSKKAPEIIEVGWSIAEGLIEAINDNLPTLIEKGADLLLNGIIPGIIENLPMLVETAFSIIAELVTAIGQALPELIPAAVSMIIQIVESLLDNIDLLIDAAIELIMGLADGILAAIPILIEKAPEIVIKLVEAIVRNAPKLLDAAVSLIGKLVEGIGSALDSLWESGKDIVNKIGDGISSLWESVKAWGGDVIGKIGEGISNAWETVKNWGKDVISKIWEGVKTTWENVKTWGQNIFDKIGEGISSAWETVKNWGKDLIENFWNGIKSKLDWFWQQISSVGQGIKDFLGFSEPKKGPLSNFHTFAPDMMELFMKGVRDNEGKLTDTVASAFDFSDAFVAPEMAFGESAFAGTSRGVGGAINLYIDGDTLVGSTSDKMDRDLGDIQTIKARWGGRKQ